MKTEPTEALRLLRETKHNPTHDIPKYKADIIARVAFSEGQSSPKIKQLEWVEDVLFSDMIVSDGFSLLFYRINMIDNTLYTGYTVQSFNTIDEAKAAAQADFERRVRECLDLKAQQKQALIDMMRWDEEIGLYDDNPKNHGYER